MMQRATRAISKLSTTGYTLLLGLVGAACGNSDGGGSSGTSGAADPRPAASVAPFEEADLASPDTSACRPALGATVDLRSASGYAILTKSGVSTVPSSVVTGNIGVSPIKASGITGFSLTMDATGLFATSPQVTGKVFAADYAKPTPAHLTTAILNMETAFTDAAGRAPGVTELGAGNIGGMTLHGGVYKWSTGLLIPTNVTLRGNCSDVWIFEIAQDLTVSSGARVVLAGGALARHVFWQVSGKANLATTVHFEGNVLSQTAIALQTGAAVHGRLLAQTSVTLDQNAVTSPLP